MLSTPVVLIIYRRPKKTRRVFDAIRKAEPDELFVVADGPKKGNEKEAELCKEARSVTETVNWQCNVYREYADTNLGCGRRPATGISWAFEYVDRAIILEDDCLPDTTFFTFCEEILERYSDRSQVMHVNGNTYGLDQREWNEYSYGFSNYPQAWGWATWRDAWESFDYEMSDWPKFKRCGMLKNIDGGEVYSEARLLKWNSVYGGTDPDIWDYQWQFAVMKNSGLSVVPRVNLVSNIGYGKRATHTTNPGGSENIKRHSLSMPIKHPPFILADKRINKAYREDLTTAIYKKLINKKNKLFSILGNH